MDAKPCRIPIVQIDTVGVHLFFSAEAGKAERVGGWVGLESWKAHSDTQEKIFFLKKEEKELNVMREVKGNVPTQFCFFFAYSFSSSHCFL